MYLPSAVDSTEENSCILDILYYFMRFSCVRQRMKEIYTTLWDFHVLDRGGDNVRRGGGGHPHNSFDFITALTIIQLWRI